MPIKIYTYDYFPLAAGSNEMDWSYMGGGSYSGGRAYMTESAVPHITDDFHSLGDIGWYASSYLLTNSSFQLIFGKINKFYSVKWVFMMAIGMFEIGSAICGASPNSTALIIGRAIAGLGSSRIFSGV
jgi:MFS family permease